MVFRPHRHGVVHVWYRLWGGETKTRLLLRGDACRSARSGTPETSPNSPSLPVCHAATARTAPAMCPRGHRHRGLLLQGDPCRLGEVEGRGPKGNYLCLTTRLDGWQETLRINMFSRKLFGCLIAVKFLRLTLRHCNKLTSRAVLLKLQAINIRGKKRTEAVRLRAKNIAAMPSSAGFRKAWAAPGDIHPRVQKKASPSGLCLHEWALDTDMSGTDQVLAVWPSPSRKLFA